MSGLEVADPYVERLLEGTALPRRARAAEARLRVPAVHAVASRDRLSRTTSRRRRRCSWRRCIRTRTIRVWPAAREPCRAARCCTRSSVRTTPRRVSSGPRTTSRFCRSRSLSASYFSFAPDLPLNTLPIAQRIKGGLRIRLKTTAGLKFAQTRIDRLCFYLAGRDDVANKLLELCSRDRPRRAGAPDRVAAPATSRCCRASAIRPVGFSDDEALLPVSVRSFQGYRLLQEYFTFPQRYRFIELAGLAPSLSRVAANEVELVVLFGRGDRHARKRRRWLVSAAVLHAGGEPLREAAHRSHSRERLDVTSSTSSRIARGRWISRSTRSPTSSAMARETTASSASCRSIRQRPATSSTTSRRISRPGASRA